MPSKKKFCWLRQFISNKNSKLSFSSVLKKSWKGRNIWFQQNLIQLMIDSYVLFAQWIEIFWHAEFVVRSELIPVWNKMLIWDMKPKMTHAAFSGLIGYRIWPPQTKPHQIKLDSRRYSAQWKPGKDLVMLLWLFCFAICLSNLVTKHHDLAKSHYKLYKQTRPPLERNR